MQQQPPTELRPDATPDEAALPLDASPPKRTWRTAGLAFLLIAIGAAVYANSFSGVFLFDDDPHIADNPRLQRLWPPWHLLTSRRPVLYLTLAANMAVNGLDTWGYHLVNVTIHILAGLTLFGVVRRTLRTVPLRDGFGPAARPLAFAVASIWLLHPLQTQSVTYIIQRSESLMGLFYFLTLYCVIRGAASRWRFPWHLGGVAACALGMGSKGVMITAPLVILLYDRTFLAGGFATALRRRWGLYLGLAGTWGVLYACGIVQAVLAPSRPAHVGFGYKGISAMSYAFTQVEVLPHYVRLALLPDALCLDYAWKSVQPAEALRRPQFWLAGLSIIFALAATAWAVVRRRPSGFVAAWSFVILAPTSSFIPIKDPAFEHRMYLPLATIIVFIILGAYRLATRMTQRTSIRATPRKLALTLLWLAVAAPLAYATIQRNKVYHSNLRMWRDVLAKQPDNYRAYLGIGAAHAREGNIDEAIAAYREALSMQYRYADAHYNLASALVQKGRIDEAAFEYSEAIRLNPAASEYYIALIQLLVKAERNAEAVEVAAQLARRRPAQAPLLDELAAGFFQRRNWDGAILALKRSIEFNPDRPAPFRNLGHAYRNAGKTDKAVEAYQQAVRLDPSTVVDRIHLAQSLGRLERYDEAVTTLHQAIALDPESAEAHYKLGWAYKLKGQVEKARQSFTRVLKIDPAHPGARQSLESLGKSSAAQP